jgi:hypothetical protein
VSHSLPIASLTEWLQVIFPSIDEGKRDVYRLPGIEPLKLLLVIPHIVATAAAETWGCSSRRENPSSAQACALRLAGSVAPRPGMLAKGRDGGQRMR